MKAYQRVAIVSLMLTLSATQSAWANSQVIPTKEQVARELPQSNFVSRFQQYGPSYALFRQWTEDDESAMEVEYSFKYILFNCDYAYDYENNQKKEGCEPDDGWKDEWYLGFNGKFDFYVDMLEGGRYSGPVINRTSNPSLHWRKYPKKGQSPFKNLTLEWIDVGYEHRSDGQVVDIDVVDEDPASPTYGQLLTQIAYDNGDHAYFDGISRGANYFLLSTSLLQVNGDDASNDCRKSGKCTTYRASLKLYTSHDSEVNWGPLANEDVSIEDYDLVRLGYTSTFAVPFKNRYVFSLDAEYTLGKKYLETDSLDLSFTFPYVTDGGFKWPWYVKMHFGPMNNLSNYTQPANSIGVGLLFTLE